MADYKNNCIILCFGVMFIPGNDCLGDAGASSANLFHKLFQQHRDNIA
ncbi:MAG: hypothetical protein ACEY3J_04760 [Arsenophonus sp.]